MLDFALGTKLRDHTVSFRLLPDLWENFHCEIDLSFEKWKEVKFLADNGEALSDAMDNLPDDKGGIYVFIAKCNTLPDISNFLMYIGRAKITDNHSLKVRCKKYFNEYKDTKRGRPKIKVLIDQWGKHLYLKYIEIDDNALTDKLEADLISSIVPPFNDQIPDKKVRDAVKAFQF